MGSEHDDDMDAEVEEGGEGETQKFAVVAEDIEDRDAESEQERLQQQRELDKAEVDEVDEG